MARKVKPKRGRPRTHPLKQGDRPQLAFAVSWELMMKIRDSQAKSGRTQSGEVEHILAQHFLTSDPMARHHGANAPLLETIADAADTASRLGESLAAGEGSDQDDTRIYSGVLEAIRLTITWNDPGIDVKIVNPQHINGGVLTWETLPIHAAWIAYTRAASDHKRLAAFKAIDAKFDRKKRSP